MSSVISNVSHLKDPKIFLVLDDYNKPGFLVYRLNNIESFLLFFFNFHFTLWHRKTITSGMN